MSEPAGDQPAGSAPPAAGAAPLFRFVQFEFPWVLGPPAGRYVLRDAGDEAALRVLVISVLGAPEKRRLLRSRRGKRADPEPPPSAVPTTRATVVRGVPVGEAEAREWLGAAAERVGPELGVLNRVLHLHRVSTAEPHVREVALEQALVVRVGFGRGEDVADGRWVEAVEPGEAKSPRARRDAALRPQERLAALLGGRDAALACEELVLRARADLDGGRLREAALQARIALDAAIAELEPWRERRDLAQRLEELRDARPLLEAAAGDALAGGLRDDAAADVERIVGRIEAALRARTADGISP